MAAPLIKVSWGTSSREVRRWYVGLYGFRSRGARMSQGLAISLRGVLLWVIALAVAAYFAIAAAILQWLNRNPYNLISYEDLILPTRWSQLESKRGLALIEEGFSDLAAQNWRPAMLNLRLGLNRAPENRRARLTLASFYLQTRQRATGLKLLLDGLKYGYPGRSYAERMISTAGQGEEYGIMLEATEQLLALPDVPPADAKWIMTRRLGALVQTERYDEVLALTEGASEPIYRESRLLALIGKKDFSTADAFLEAWAKSDDAEVAQILRLSVRLAREMNDPARLKENLDRLIELDPAGARSTIFAIVQTSMMGEEKWSDEYWERFYFRFGASADNILLAAAPLAEIGDTARLGRLAKFSREQGIDPLRLAQLEIECDLRNEDWLAMRSKLRQISSRIDKTDAAQQFWFDILERLGEALISEGEGPQVDLVSYCREHYMPLALSKRVADALISAKRWNSAREVLFVAQKTFPNSTAVKSLLATVESQVDVIAADQMASRETERAARIQASTTTADQRMSAEQVMALQKARREALAGVGPTENAGDIPGGNSKDEFLAGLHSLADREDWPAINARVLQIRRLRPAWLSGANLDLLRWEMRASVAQGNLLLVQSQVRQFFGGSNALGLEVMGFVGQAEKAGHREVAEMLVNEVLRKSPQFPPALRKQAEWAAEKAAAEAAAQVEPRKL